MISCVSLLVFDFVSVSSKEKGIRKIKGETEFTSVKENSATTYSRFPFPRIPLLIFLSLSIFYGFPLLPHYSQPSDPEPLVQVGIGGDQGP